MTEDLGILKWDEANEMCAKISRSWRLPTIRELELLHDNMDSIGGFKTRFYVGRGIHGYWSSEEDSPGSVAAYYFNFSNAGHYKLLDKAFGNHVRAVRTIK